MCDPAGSSTETNVVSPGLMVVLRIPFCETESSADEASTSFLSSVFCALTKSLFKSSAKVGEKGPGACPPGSSRARI